jgi:hypothetical protein
MGRSPREWMGLDEKAFDAWMRNGALPSDMSVPEDGRDCVYFVQVGGHVKIGTSTRTEARLSNGQTMNALPMKLPLALAGDRNACAGPSRDVGHLELVSALKERSIDRDSRSSP